MPLSCRAGILPAAGGTGVPACVLVVALAFSCAVPPFLRLPASLSIPTITPLLQPPNHHPFGLRLVQHAIEQTRSSGPSGSIGEWQPSRQLLLTEPDWAVQVFWWLFWLNPRGCLWL